MSTAVPATSTDAVRARVGPAFAAFLLGIALFFVAGFSAPAVLHNATHDTRHALGLPCH